MINTLNTTINYLFPPDYYRGNKITDIKWIRMFMPFAPYTALGLFGLLISCGMITNHPFLSALLIPFAIMMLAWIAIFLKITGALKRRHRSPAIPLLIANGIPLLATIGLCLIVGFRAPLREKLTQEREQFSRLVDNKIKERKEFITEKTNELEKRFYRQQAATKKAIQEIGDKIPDVGVLGERFRELIEQQLKDEAEASKKRWAKVDAKMKEESIQRWKESRKWFKNNGTQYSNDPSVEFTKENQEEELSNVLRETPSKD